MASPEKPKYEIILPNSKPAPMAKYTSLVESSANQRKANLTKNKPTPVHNNPEMRIRKYL